MSKYRKISATPTPPSVVIITPIFLPKRIRKIYLHLVFPSRWQIIRNHRLLSFPFSHQSRKWQHKTNARICEKKKNFLFPFLSCFRLKGEKIKGFVRFRESQRRLYLCFFDAYRFRNRKNKLKSERECTTYFLWPRQETVIRMGIGGAPRLLSFRSRATCGRNVQLSGSQESYAASSLCFRPVL